MTEQVNPMSSILEDQWLALHKKELENGSVVFDGEVVTYGNVKAIHPQMVNQLAKRMGSETLDLLHGAVGVAGEAGELLDAVKKAWVYNKPLDIVNLVEEIGDIYFYLEWLQQVAKISKEEILHHNMAKLSKRYSAGYSDAAAQARADKSAES